MGKTVADMHGSASAPAKPLKPSILRRRRRARDAQLDQFQGFQVLAPAAAGCKHPF